jgi:hypothetical protein
MEERKAELLGVPYFHVVFTVPVRIGAIAYQNKAVIYDLLFKASSQTMLTTVTFAPGRLRLATRSNETGSMPLPKTIGMVVVATITATRRRTRSAASAGSRSGWFSAQRYSTATFWPST